MSVEPSGSIAKGIIDATASSQGPIIRIGLIANTREVRISSAVPYYVKDKRAEASLQELRGESRIRIERQDAEISSGPIFQVQVASFAQRENAEALRKKLSADLDVPVRIHESESSGTHQVRIGEFPTRGKAYIFSKTLAGAEYQDAFIVESSGSPGKDQAIMALRGTNDNFLLSEAGFLFQPSSETGFLCVNDKPYRGLIDIILSSSGRITVVNQIGMEDYLLGVVPAEISPTTYPEFEALAALSIAARTYALRNMGRFRAEGFDLSDDDRTQVYGGVGAEKDATTEAVRATHGLAIYYENKLIDAMYMSTCGGRTEDFSNVYDAAPVPYLKSVFCAIEGEPGKGEVIIEGEHKLPGIILADDGRIANRNLELARILGLMNFGAETPLEYFTEPAKRNEILRWIKNAGSIAKQHPIEDLPKTGEIETRAGFLQLAAEAFWGADQIRQKISPRDADYYTANLRDGSSLSEPLKYAVAYLMQSGLWHPYPDNTVQPDAFIRRCDAVYFLVGCMQHVRPDLLQKGTFVEGGAAEDGKDHNAVLGVKQGKRTHEFYLSANPPLFRLDRDRFTPVGSLRIIGNEEISFHLNASGRVDYLEMELNPTGASSDRYSPLATWEVSFTRSDMEEKLRKLAGSIGELIDIKPARLGKSGRVVQLEVIGSRNSVVLRGYRVRGALGLKDTLYTIARERDPDGHISSFTLYGRGFGHGIGLCQVGAFGMARAGRSNEEILKHYYQGVDIRKAY
jgi:stage II sporulation protein D